MTNISYLFVSKNEVKSLDLKQTKSGKMNETSLPVVQSWRGNIDIQLILNKLDPCHPNFHETLGIIRYIVSYFTKRLSFERRTKNDRGLHSKGREFVFHCEFSLQMYYFCLFTLPKNTVKGFGTVTKKCVNMFSSKIICIQKAQCGIM